MKIIKLDKEEQLLLKGNEQGEWREVKNMASEINRYKELAKKSLRKSRRINIRLVENDLAKIQVKVIREGIPYQTLISSVLHKYASGQLMSE